MQDNKARQIRIERKGKAKVHEDDNQHLWAVSYSDFLMVLLSFFILFYSADENSRESLMQRISLHFSMDQSTTAKTEGVAPVSRIPASLKELDPNLKIESSVQNETVYIHLPENFFGPGQYNLSKKQEVYLSQILKRLSPVAGEINLTFEGHSDQAPVTQSKKRNSLIRSNYVLSSLRADGALEIAKKIGYKEDHLFINASSSNKRNSRSLTIKITQQGVAP